MDSLRVLIVEDLPEDALLMVAMLRRRWAQVFSRRVETPEAFQEALRTEAWDVVLADYSLPRFSAGEALRLLHASAVDLPFLVVTGTVGESIAVEMMKAGAHDYLLKDHLTRLAAAVERECREAGDRRGRRLAEERLHVIERRQQLILGSLPIAFYSFQAREGGWTPWFSESIERVCGFPARRFAEEPEFWASRIHPEDRDAGRKTIVRTLSGRPMVVEYRWRCVDDSYHWFLDHGVLTTDVAGEPDEVVGHILDVSDRKQLELQLIQTQRMEAIGRLAGGLSHDFNNYLGIILGFSDLSLGQMKEDDPQWESLREIQKAAQRAAEFVQQLLVMSRRTVVEPVVLDLNELLHGMERVIHTLLGPRIVVELVPSGAPAVVKGDRGQLEQVVINLVLNARDAMAEGGRLTLETSAVQLGAAESAAHPGLPPGRYVQLVVRDTGSGIPQALLPRVFDPFFSTKGPREGTGLGLASVHATVAQSAGVIWVDSTEGKGTAFTILLPEAGERPRPLSPAPRPLPAAPGPRASTVLLAEDEPALRSLLADYLRGQGYTVFDAGNPRHAIELSQSRTDPIELLITDVVMPEMNGQELARRILASRPGIRVLYISGYTHDVVLRDGAEGAPVHFLQKPFQLGAFEAKIREVMEAPHPGDPGTERS